MDNEKIVGGMAEFELLEKQASAHIEQLEELSGALFHENAALVQLIVKRDGLERNAKDSSAVERRLYRAEIKTVKAEIEHVEDKVRDIESETKTVALQQGELTKRMHAVLQDIEKLRKEDKMNELASSGDPQAQFDLAIFYFDNMDYAKGMERLQEAAVQGHEEAKRLMQSADRKFGTRNSELGIAVLGT